MIKPRMVKVKRIVDHFVKSLIPHHNYYARLFKTRLFASFIHYVSLVSMISLLASLILFSGFTPNQFSKTLTRIISSLQEYPPSLVIFISQGRLFTTDNKPYFVWLNDDQRRQLLLVVDESSETSEIQSYNSKFLLTDRYLVIRSAGQIETSIPIKLFRDTRIDKAKISTLNNFIVQLRSVLIVSYIGAFIVLLILLILTSLIVNGIYIGIASFISWAIMKYYFLKGTHTHVHIKPVIKLSLYAATLPLIVDYLLGLLNARPPYLPLLFLVLLTLFTSAAVYEAYSGFKGRA